MRHARREGSTGAKPREFPRFNLPRRSVRCTSQRSRMGGDGAKMPVRQSSPG
jgi:hypothetical protein